MMERSHPETEHRALVTRRALVGASAAAATGAALGLGASRLTAQTGTPAASPAASPVASPTAVSADTFVEPDVRASENGQLMVTLQAMQEETSGIPRLTYGTMRPGPTLRIRPGDTVKVALVNALSEMTNLHVHGLHVSPSGNGDNIFLHVDPGQTFNYEYDIPENHIPGTYWYHPHAHGHSAEQVGAGLAGAIIVEGGLDDLPGIQGLKDRILVLQGPFAGPNKQPQYLVNGQINPVIEIQPGETQRWRLLNLSANAFFNLRLSGHAMHRIAIDGSPLPETQTVDVQLLGPGERAEVLIQGGPAGIYEFQSVAWSPDIPSQAQDQFLVATMVSGGEATTPADLPTTLIPFDDLNDDPIAETREITFQENTSGPAFAIDNLAFVDDRVDQVVKLGTTEEWTIRNTSPEWHPFHIHVNDFQVMSRNGTPESPHYEDTTLLPPNGEVVIRTRFADFTGKFVYHCHILVHEDAGMMAVVEVVE
ncbi:MAG: multicopper oxidase family protein [Chloroflexota bacterium]|nr:multicopper oxidase family protein [Chloroflexota bacterium]